MRLETLTRRLPQGSALAAAVLLTACDSGVTVDVLADPPPNVSSVSIPIKGVQFEDDSGDTDSIELDTADPVDLISYQNGTLYRLVTDEKLSKGDYNGVRLLFGDEEDATVTRSDGGVYPVNFDTNSYADVDFSLSDNDNEEILFAIDLRLSLAWDDDAEEYTFEPVTRAVREKDASTLSGVIDENLIDDCDEPGDAAVYLFENEDVDPDDYDDESPDPIATTPVRADGTGSYVYAFDALSEGKYTVSFTCEGNEENPSEDDDIDFEQSENVSIDSDESADQDFD
jgi:hypothetical protein